MKELRNELRERCQVIRGAVTTVLHPCSPPRSDTQLKHRWIHYCVPRTRSRCDLRRKYQSGEAAAAPARVFVRLSQTDPVLESLAWTRWQ